jgi:hypothetical protein
MGFMREATRAGLTIQTSITALASSVPGKQN